MFNTLITIAMMVYTISLFYKAEKFFRQGHTQKAIYYMILVAIFVIIILK
jgi:hypothetical protein